MHSSPADKNPVCVCCGVSSHAVGGWILLGSVGSDGHWRCKRHADRNPCIVEGCSKTRLAGRHGHGVDDVICGPHWRLYVPPGSPLRRTYNRFWRIAKKKGWDAPLARRFNRFWYGLVKSIRRRSTMPAGEVTVSSSPPPAAMLEELKRLGL